MLLFVLEEHPVTLAAEHACPDLDASLSLGIILGPKNFQCSQTETSVGGWSVTWQPCGKVRLSLGWLGPCLLLTASSRAGMRHVWCCWVPRLDGQQWARFWLCAQYGKKKKQKQAELSVCLSTKWRQRFRESPERIEIIAEVSIHLPWAVFPEISCSLSYNWNYFWYSKSKVFSVAVKSCDRLLADSFTSFNWIWLCCQFIAAYQSIDIFTVRHFQDQQFWNLAMRSPWAEIWFQVMMSLPLPSYPT